jgi:hypothetical protein
MQPAFLLQHRLCKPLPKRIVCHRSNQVQTSLPIVQSSNTNPSSSESCPLRERSRMPKRQSFSLLLYLQRKTQKAETSVGVGSLEQYGQSVIGSMVHSGRAAGREGKLLSVSIGRYEDGLSLEGVWIQPLAMAPLSERYTRGRVMD